MRLPDAHSLSTEETYLDREVVDGVPTQLAHSKMAVLARALEERDTGAEERDLFLLLLQLAPLLLYFLVRDTL